MRNAITASIAFVGLSDVEFTDALKLAKAHLDRGSMIAGRKCGLPRTAVEICDDAHLSDIAKFIRAHGITPDRMMLFIHIASDNVDQSQIPGVAITAIREFALSDVRVTVVPPYDEE